MSHIARTSTSAPATLAAAAVVRAYFDAINAGDYAQAWRLGGDKLGGSYEAFAEGFSDTVSDTLDIVGTSGDAVSVSFKALHTDGGEQSFVGTYVVNGSVIIRAYVSLTSQSGGNAGGLPIVHPGAFCAPVGSRGVTDRGTLMRCTSKPGGTEARWRRY
ncbi:MAG: hypothetical protein ACRDSS_03440 [Actinocrinis sp.]